MITALKHIVEWLVFSIGMILQGLFYIAMGLFSLLSPVVFIPFFLVTTLWHALRQRQIAEEDEPVSRPVVLQQPSVVENSRPTVKFQMKSPIQIVHIVIVVSLVLVAVAFFKVADVLREDLTQRIEHQIQVEKKPNKTKQPPPAPVADAVVDTPINQVDSTDLVDKSKEETTQPVVATVSNTSEDLGNPVSLNSNNTVAKSNSNKPPSIKPQQERETKASPLVPKDAGIF